jgi:hypothetical protein
MAKIFKRDRLSPGQLRTVAERRYDDAECLRKTGENARANGVFYLGGFVIKCLLKAMMLERYPSMQRLPSSEDLSPQDKRIWSLIYRSHDLKGMLGHLPDVLVKLERLDHRDGRRRYDNIIQIASNWTIFARYSPQTAMMEEADEFLGHVKELKECLK